MRRRITIWDRIKSNPNNLLCRTKFVDGKVKFYFINNAWDF